MDQRPQYPVYSQEVQQKLRQGVDLEIKRFSVAQQFPVSEEMAQIHYKANRYGYKSSDEDRVCPCCLQRIKEKQFGFWSTSMMNNFLTPDIILLFSFIRALMIFLVLKLLITDGYSLWMNYQGHECGVGKQTNCNPKMTSKLSTTNRMSSQQTLFVTDLLNLVFLIVSIIFWTIYQRYSYKKLFIDVAAQIQSEDDFSVFVEDIPVVQDINAGVIDYRKALKEYFSNIVVEWLKNPTDDELYKSYEEAARKNGHAPNNPQKIVAKINLCWNLYELTALHELKQEIQQMYEAKAKEQAKLHPEKQGYKLISAETCDELTTLNTTQVELCQQFQMNQKFGFALSRFLGKAFISFQYQHFAIYVIRTIVSAKRFLKDITLRVSHASFPRDVYWENLNLPDEERATRIKTTYTITTGCLILAFLAFLGIKYYQITHERQLKHTEWLNWVIRMSTSLLSVSVTMLLYYVIDELSLFQEHGTKSRYEVSYVYKAVTAVFFNNIINICIAHYILKIDVWSTEGLSLQIINTGILWFITQSLYHAINFNWILRWIKLRWKYRSLPILKFQNRFNKEYVLPTYPLPSRYTSYIGDLYFLCFFSYLAPASGLIGLLSFIAYYLIDKVNILKRSSFHSNYSYFLADKVVHLAQTSTLLFSLGNYLFAFVLTGKKYNAVNLLSIIISILYLAIVWGNKKYVRCFDEYIVYEDLSYTDCTHQNKFFDTYNSCNPATKLSSKESRNKVYLGVTAPINSMSFKPTAADDTNVVWKIGQENAKQTKA